MVFPKVWDIISIFKHRCRSIGWRASEVDDWVMNRGRYHKFVWVHNVHPSTFLKLSSKKPCIVREGISYHVVNAAYIAWIFLKSPPKDILEKIVEDPQFSRRTALYDLSQIYRGRLLCLKINRTNSEVFEEFEKFLNEEMGVQIKLIEEENKRETEETVLV